MYKPLILVTGAAGKTGAPVVKQLLERGYPVRAMVRTIDSRSQRLTDLGAEVVVADFQDLQSLRRAMEGVARAYFCYPPFEGLLQATTNLAIAARDEGVEAVVNMSQLPAREDAGSALSREHWRSEQVLDWADVGASHVRPTFFSEDLYIFTGGSIAREGKVYLPFGSGKHAPVSSEDIARVVTEILIDPTSHIGKRYVLTGPKDMTVQEMAEAIGQELDKKVDFVNIPVEAWTEGLRNQGGMPEYLVKHLGAVAIDHQNGVFSAETKVVEEIGGRPPETVGSFVRRNRDIFESPEPTLAPKTSVA